MTFWQNLREIFFVSVQDRRNIAEARNILSQRPQLDAKSFAETYFPTDKQAIAEKLWKITKEHSVADITGVVPADHFVQELRMDDLDSMSLVGLTVAMSDSRTMGAAGAVDRGLGAAVGATIGMFINCPTVEIWGCGIWIATV